MSEIKVNKISPKQTCTQLTLGDSGDTIIVTSGANLNTDTIKNLNSSSIITQTNATTITLGFSGSTIAIASGASQTGFGRSGTVNWDTTAKTSSPVTAVSGTGYFINTTSGAITVNLPAGTAGDIVAVSDYANTAATNNIIIAPNGTDKINGGNFNYKITTNGVAITLVYVDSTRGWKDINDATLDATGESPFILATGGTVTTCGDFKIHTFTGPGTFTVTSAGTPAGSNSVNYLVVAGGAGGGGRHGGGGGAGGFRQNFPSPSTAGLPVIATTYPITVGSGGATSGGSGSNGNPSIFSTITSAGGGNGKNTNPEGGGAGGSGGGGAVGSPGGPGNNPPTSPSQGNDGGNGGGPLAGSGGGGHTSAGTPGNASPGGSGTATSITGSSISYAGGGGGGQFGSSPAGTGGTGGGGNGGHNGTNGAIAQNGTTNRGGGGGGGGSSFPAPYEPGGTGGSGIVVVRYKYQ
jgi:hypothetical protein